MALESYQTQLVDDSLTIGALKFGSFTLKSGRVSPYFFNAGLISTGPLLNSLCTAYAHTISKALSTPGPTQLPKFDVIFGPAYKGISLAAVTAVLLHTRHRINVGFAYDRKEAKDHGEGGRMVGVPVAGKRVLILDDVMTAGTAVRGAIEMIRQAGGEVVGVVLALDREEVGHEGGSAVKELETELGGEGRVTAILRMRDLIAWLQDKGRHEDIERMQTYWEQFGVKE
ncbi:orotate phosphoribosyltransferase [Russula earlei]|uniref:Orotate phosphoribosyltransferase n=1 Tax=Russula earlei TaxID=71964 RepID=A0ACC0U877_9AGAM|nr:orotate phosphoribosyltransferase [Russula earlei]